VSADVEQRRVEQWQNGDLEGIVMEVMDKPEIDAHSTAMAV
jgi:hypothetical protein